jgi:hypothetical protein
VDDASVGIPDLYVISGLTLAEGLAQVGRTAQSDTVFRQARAVATAMRRDKVFGFDRMQALPGVPTDSAATPLPLAPPPGGR